MTGSESKDQSFSSQGALGKLPGRDQHKHWNLSFPSDVPSALPHSKVQESERSLKALSQEQLDLGLLLSQIWGRMRGFRQAARSPRSVMRLERGPGTPGPAVPFSSLSPFPSFSSNFILLIFSLKYS